MKKILFLLLFIIFLPNNLFAKLIITNFDETVKFTDFGRQVNIKIKARVELERNYFYKEWAYIFDKRLKIEISQAKVIGKQYKTTFGNNELRFQFDKAVNSEFIEFDFSYLQFNDNEVKYSRQEYVALPAFSEGAEGSLIVEIPLNLAVYSLNKNFKQNGNIYTWKNKISNGGFSDFFFLTLRQARWKVDILSQITGKENIIKLDANIPLYFKNGNNIIENYHITTNYTDFSVITENKDSIDINFKDIKAPLLQIKVEGILKNDFDNKVWIKLNPNNYLTIDEKLSRELNNLIYKIKFQQITDEPLYVTLAKWVNKNIKYDIRYLGKDMDIINILETGRGVCVHYAQLYNDLLRAVGIPSVIVSGISYDTEKKEFENHAWNLVYVNGDWISVDPTWGLYSGKLPVSHIFFYFGERPVVEYTIFDTSSTDFKTDVSRSIKFLE